MCNASALFLCSWISGDTRGLYSAAGLPVSKPCVGAQLAVATPLAQHLSPGPLLLAHHFPAFVH